MSFLVSIARNSNLLVGQAGHAARPHCSVLSSPISHVELDVMWAGVGGGTLAYLIHRVRAARGDESHAHPSSGPTVVLVLARFPAERGLALAWFHCLRAGVDEARKSCVWVGAVATAVLAAVIAKLIFFAPGALASVPLSVRLVAIMLPALPVSSCSGVRSSPALPPAKRFSLSAR